MIPFIEFEFSGVAPTHDLPPSLLETLNTCSVFELEDFSAAAVVDPVEVMDGEATTTSEPGTALASPGLAASRPGGNAVIGAAATVVVATGL